jgi:succinate-semialdehyde dehydrogenase / glutarate-semialdehyde dehydrogenase
MSRGIASVNPATGELLRQFEPISEAELERRLEAAAACFREYRRMPLPDRARRMERAAAILESDKEPLARIMTLEMGKPLRAAVQEIEKCARTCRYFAEHAGRFLGEEEVPTEADRSSVRFEPLGPILAVMPWNFPFWQLFRFAAPALMAGNVALMKHASNVPQCALAIEEVFRRAEFPEGVLQALLIGSDRVAPLIADQRIRAVTLTGSVAAGRSVAAEAGKYLKKCVLELGGSDPFLVMPSADLNRAIATAVQARIINNGQSCIAAKRFIVHETIAAEFERRFVDRMAALRVGDPMEENTDLGPLATVEVRDGLEQQVRETVARGARVLLGGKRCDGPGYFFAPTVLADIPPGSPASCEELFGPVACLFRARDLHEAVRIANDTPFGLGACAWTTDAAEQEFFIQNIEAGAVVVNGMVASDPRLPFGGVKDSGFGRELGREGIREFVNVKSVSVDVAREQSNASE